MRADALDLHGCRDRFELLAAGRAIDQGLFGRAVTSSTENTIGGGDEAGKRYFNEPRTRRKLVNRRIAFRREDDTAPKGGSHDTNTQAWAGAAGRLVVARTE
jgi:hypothetical protein